MENIGIGLTTTIIGMGIVFSVLGLLTVVLSLLKYAAPKNEEKKTNIASNADQTNKKKAPHELTNEELTAIITAALSAHLSSSPSEFIVRSIKRTKRWNAAARNIHVL